MDPGRQIVRFSIPGAVLILELLGVILVVRRIQGMALGATFAAVATSDVSAIGTIVATVPLGFVIYQIYYSAYRPTVRIWPSRRQIVRLDRGGQILDLVFTEGQLHAIAEVFGRTKKLDVGKVYKKSGSWLPQVFRVLVLNADVEVSDYERRWYENWDVLRAIVDLAGSTPGGSHVRKEHGVLLDVYHALGAARVSIDLGLLGGLAVVASDTHAWKAHPVETAIGVAVASVLSACLWVIFHFSRIRTWKSAEDSLVLALRWLFAHDPQFVIPAGADDRPGLLQRLIRRIGAGGDEPASPG